jgi:hypothetical protein
MGTAVVGADCFSDACDDLSLLIPTPILGLLAFEVQRLQCNG